MTWCRIGSIGSEWTCSFNMALYFCTRCSSSPGSRVVGVWERSKRDFWKFSMTSCTEGCEDACAVAGRTGGSSRNLRIEDYCNTNLRKKKNRSHIEWSLASVMKHIFRSYLSLHSFDYATKKYIQITGLDNDCSSVATWGSTLIGEEWSTIGRLRHYQEDSR